MCVSLSGETETPFVRRNNVTGSPSPTPWSLYFNSAGKAEKQVNLAEDDIRALCLVARDVFLDQPCLLQLATPIKICGEFDSRKNGTHVLHVVFLVLKRVSEKVLPGAGGGIAPGGG